MAKKILLKISGVPVYWERRVSRQLVGSSDG